MSLQMSSYCRVLCLHAAAKRLQIPERTLRYRASRGRIQGAFKQGKLWKFPVTALESTMSKEQADHREMFVPPNSMVLTEGLLEHMEGLR